MSTMSEALRLIVAKSNHPAAPSDAMRCLRAIEVKSPMVQSRYNHVVAAALEYPGDYDAGERAILAEHLATEGEREVREVVSLRLTPSEQAQIAEAAAGERLSVSDYMRKRLLS